MIRKINGILPYGKAHPLIFFHFLDKQHEKFLYIPTFSGMHENKISMNQFYPIESIKLEINL